MKIVIALLLMVGLGLALWRMDMKTNEQFEQAWGMEYMPGPADNPLKGFFPYRGDFRDAFPHSMEWDYFPLNKLMPEADDYDFSALEEALDDCASRRHQMVMRVYVDYPTKESGLPKYLIAAGVKLRRYEEHGGGFAPDYDDERLVGALESFIAEFGRRYDGDPRLGFITVGLLGFWGEWHTYPHEDWFANEATQNRVIEAYAAAFKTTKLLARRPAGRSPMLPVGYHDDSFAFSTLPTIDWHFVSQLRRAAVTNHWQRLPIGGELRPEIQRKIWQRPIPAELQHEDFSECVRLTHCSWLLSHELFSEPLAGAEYERSVEGAGSLGYQIHVAAVSVVATNAILQIRLDVENRGVAPFYYDWPVALLVRNEAGETARHVTPWKLTKVLPGAPAVWTVDVPREVDGFELRLHVENPMTNGMPFRFANRQGATEEWLLLGKVRVQP